MNLMKTLFAAGALALAGGAASAATVNPDLYLGEVEISGSSSPTVEIAALCDLIGILPGDCSSVLELDNKFESGELTIEQDEVNDDVFFVDIAPDTPGWFILKFGVGNTGLATHYFFENLAELSILAWNVTDGIDFADAWDCVAGNKVGGGSNECALSHITTVVPLPAAGFLLIGGLGGLMALRRRKS